MAAKKSKFKTTTLDFGPLNPRFKDLREAIEWMDDEWARKKLGLPSEPWSDESNAEVDDGGSDRRGLMTSER